MYVCVSVFVYKSFLFVCVREFTRIHTHTHTHTHMHKRCVFFEFQFCLLSRTICIKSSQKAYTNTQTKLFRTTYATKKHKSESKTKIDRRSERVSMRAHTQLAQHTHKPTHTHHTHMMDGFSLGFICVVL